MSDDENNSILQKKLTKGLVYIQNKDNSYYPQECYIEDFEIEKINTLKILENFKPIDADN
ncbi:hypothetical protein [Agrobacterium burrii]